MTMNPREEVQKQNWDALSDVRKDYWKRRDTLTLLELAFILKDKEPNPKATQRNVADLYPIEFTEFYADILTLSDSSWKRGLLKEINPPALYFEEGADSPEFEKDVLIEWVVSKDIPLPDWLMPKSKFSIEESKATIEKFPFLDSDNPFYSTKLHHAYQCWMALYGPGGSIRKLYDEDPEHKVKGDYCGKAIEDWLKENHEYPGDRNSNGVIHEIFKILNPDSNPQRGNDRRKK